MSISAIGDGYALKNAGDIVSHDGTAQIVVPVGTDGQVLKTNSSQSAGIQWVGFTSYPSQVFQISQSSTSGVMAGASSITISNIPQTYDDLLIIVCASLTSPQSMNIRLNGITTAATYPFRNVRIYSAGSATDNYEASNSHSAVLDAMYSVGYGLGAWEFYFPNYSATGGKYFMLKGAGGPGTVSNATQAINFGYGGILGSSLSTALTSVTIYNNNTGTIIPWGSGSGYAMYGIKR